MFCVLIWDFPKMDVFGEWSFYFWFPMIFFLKMKKYIWVVLYIYLKSFCRFLSEDQPSDKSSNKSCQLDVKTLFYYFLKNITDLLYVIHLQTRGSINLIYKLKGPFDSLFCHTINPYFIGWVVFEVTTFVF
jgi:hypothetical protein